MSKYVLNERAQAVQDRFEVPVLVAALAVIPVLLIEEQTTSAVWLDIAAVANWVIWLVFLAEYVAVLRLASGKLAYTRSAWLGVVIIVVSFPVLPALFATGRLARLTRLTRVLRILRLARLAAVLTRGRSAFKRIFGRAGLGYILGVIGLLALGFGTLIAIAEPDVTTPLDGIWWAVVTLTTVGYGDISPSTGWGRAMAIILMMIGIGVVSVLTAAVAARFVEEDEASDVDQFAALHERLDHLELLIREITGQGNQPPGSGRETPAD